MFSLWPIPSNGEEDTEVIRTMKVGASDRGFAATSTEFGLSCNVCASWQRGIEADAPATQE